MLGPLEVHNGLEWTDIGAAKQRALLALLLLNPNRVVPSDQLIAELWGERPPISAAGLVAGYVWRLRRKLGDTSGELLVTRAPGYQLIVAPGVIDVQDYEDLIAAGRRQLATEDLSGAVVSFSKALDLWRGGPLADVPMMPSVMAETARLEESRLAVIEGRIGAEIDLGRHEALLPELKLMVAQHPLRERLHAHLMLALYRSGQQADALGAYQDLRRLLVDELGIEPSKPLRELQQRILQEDPELLRVAGPTLRETILSPEPAPPAPRVHDDPPTRPAGPSPSGDDPHDGPDELISDRFGSGDPPAMRNPSASGSTLVLRVARAVSEHFPDGQIYLDLRGAGANPLRPHEVLTRLLSALGIAPEDVPATVDAAATCWHALSAKRRVLVVLDDVVGAAQVQPVLDRSGGSAVILLRSPSRSRW